MKLTKSYLKQVIAEELNKLNEAHGDRPANLPGDVLADKDIIANFINQKYKIYAPVTVTKIEPLQDPFYSKGEVGGMSPQAASYTYRITFKTSKGTTLRGTLNAYPKNPGLPTGTFAVGKEGNFYSLESGFA